MLYVLGRRWGRTTDVGWDPDLETGFVQGMSTYVCPQFSAEYGLNGVQGAAVTLNWDAVVFVLSDT